MNADNRFDRLDDLTRELEEESDVHLVDIETNEDEIVATADVGGVRVEAWYDDDGDLCMDSNDERFDDPDDAREHVNKASSDDDLCALLDEAEWLRSQHGNPGLSDYRDHLRGDA
jgi:hypothetical protein